MLRRIVKEALSIYKEPTAEEVNELEGIVKDYLNASNNAKDDAIDILLGIHLCKVSLLEWMIARRMKTKIRFDYRSQIASYILLELRKQAEQEKEQGQHE